MGLKDFLKRLVAAGDGHKETAPTARMQRRAEPGAPPAGPGKDVGELARRLGMTISELMAVTPSYQTFTIPKRKGGQRKILAPAPPLKALQKKILRRLLSRLRVHPAVRGFERGQSIVTHARGHARKAVVLHMDIKDFFPSTAAWRVHDYFRRIGWNKDAAELLTRLTTYENGLPQGAPTSPRISNLVNYRMDVRLAAVAAYAAGTLGGADPQSAGKSGAGPGPRADGEGPCAVLYTRYADDLTFSFDREDRHAVAAVIRITKAVVRDEGYELHQKKKLRIMRRHDRQVVTGLVVNDGPRLPREVRRRLRAVRHHLSAGKPATLTPAQLAGWDSLQKMVVAQSQA